MPVDLEPFPDVEEVLKALVIEAIADYALPAGWNDVGAEIPDDMHARLPFCLVERVSGERTRLVDYPVCDVEWFSLRRDQAKFLSERFDSFVLGYPRSVKVDDQTVTFDSVRVLVAPSKRPWEVDGRLRRHAATYAFTVRR